MATLIEKIQAEYKKASGSGAIIHAYNCGKLLNKAKGLCNRGEWTPWLKSNWVASVRLANDYMRLWLAIEEGKIKNWKALSIDQALRLLRKRTRKVVAAVEVDTAEEVKKTAVEKLTSRVLSMVIDANKITYEMYPLRTGPNGLTAEWHQVKLAMREALHNHDLSYGKSSRSDSGETRHECGDNYVQVIAEHTLSGESGLGEHKSWAGNGLRVTIRVEIVE